MISWMPVLGLSILLGQTERATLFGVVRDAHSGDRVAGALVALTDLDRATISGSDGRYSVHEIPPGLQHLEVRRIGYATRMLHVFVPATGRVEIHISLQQEPVSLRGLDVFPPVVVRGMDSESAETAPGAVDLSAAAVRSHPLLAEPDVFAALSGGTVSTDPEAPTGLHIHGGRADQVTFLLDGVPILNAYHSVGLFSAWNPDALARLRLEPIPSGTVAPDALSGVVAAETRRPGPEVRAHGAISTTQARFTVDGPLPLLDGGFLVSGRRGFPGFPQPDGELSYVRGRTADWLAKLEGGLGGGEFRLVGYENRNRTGTAARIGQEAGEGTAVGTSSRNGFDWMGGSWGGEWTTAAAHGSRLRVRGWHASADAAARWSSDDPGPVRLASARRDLGAALVLETGDSTAATIVGVRVSRSRTAYDLRLDGTGLEESSPPWCTTAVVAASFEHARRLGPQLRVEAGLLGVVYEGVPRLAPRLGGEWAPAAGVRVSASLARTHQVEQSLANAESVVRYVFPPALYAGVGTRGVPLAQSDQAIVAVQFRPFPGIRIAAEAYVRDIDGLVLVAPATSQPFAMDGFAVGSGAASGVALDLSLSRARYALLASYGFQRVRYSYGDTSYVPAFAAAHTLAAGAIVRPRPSISIRLGLTGLSGRRSTALVGPFEWETCNLWDQGCEFAGSPQRRSGPLGSVRPPTYLRLDAGARKHWHLRLAHVDAEMGIHASATNVLGRRNLLTLTLDPATGEHEWIEMQSRVPLVIGLDWRF